MFQAYSWLQVGDVLRRKVACTVWWSTLCSARRIDWFIDPWRGTPCDVTLQECPEAGNSTNQTFVDRFVRTKQAHKPRSCRQLSVADPGFSRGGGANSKKCYYLANSFPKTAWNWKNLDPQGGRASLAPPLRSANDYFTRLRANMLGTIRQPSHWACSNVHKFLGNFFLTSLNFAKLNLVFS